MQACALTHMHVHGQTNWLREGEMETVWLRLYPQSNPDIQYFFLCCDSSVLDSAFCEWNCWQTQQNKTLHQELPSQKSNEYFKLALVLWYFWSSFSLCSCDRAHLECLVELVSLDSLERRSAFPLSDCTTCVCADSEEVVVCVWTCVLLCVWCVCWSFQVWRWEVMQKYIFLMETW